MNAMLWKNRLLFALCVVAISAAQTQAAPKLSEIRRGKVFVRFSPDVFAELQRQPFKKRTKVDDVILGTKVYGHCETQGTAKLEPNQDEKGFKLVVTGHCVTTSVGENGPATIRSTTTTDFVATNPITFDREIGFQAGQV